jgi:hypothetical protein
MVLVDVLKVFLSALPLQPFFLPWPASKVPLILVVPLQSRGGFTFVLTCPDLRLPCFPTSCPLQNSTPQGMLGFLF